MTDASDQRNVALRALVCLDLTNLEEDCDPIAIDALCRRAQTPHGSTAAVCVWPRFARQARDALEHTGIRVATVVNFPTGDEDIGKVKDDARAVLSDGADEIDVVVPWRKLVAGEPASVAATVREIKDVCGEATLKAILETGELASAALIAQAAEAALDGGADFLKTSTGKVRVNATPEAARILLQAIARRGGSVGFKPAGGVRSVADAGAYLGLCDEILGPGWAGPRRFRIGASGLLDALLATLDDAERVPEDDDY